MSHVVALHSAACTVRSYRDTDAASLARPGDNRAIWINLRDAVPHPSPAESGVAYIARVSEAPVPTSFAIDVGSEAVGGIALHPGSDVERFGAELGYWVGESFWGRGVVSAAVQLVTAYGFERLELQRIFALPFTRNPASVRVLEKAGYTREGHLHCSAFKAGAWEDQYLYARLRG